MLWLEESRRERTDLGRHGSEAKKHLVDLDYKAGRGQQREPQLFPEAPASRKVLNTSSRGS